ncbi:MAG: DUF6410 domain-containing protein [bacterium]
MMPSTHAGLGLAPPAEFLIGNSVGPFGRWFRLFVGLNSVIYLVINPILLHPMAPAELVPYAARIGLWFAGLLAIYHALFFLFGKLMFDRLTPWVGTAVFLGLPTLGFVFGWFPDALQVAFGLYLSVSLVATFFLRYGGCEAVAFPSLVFKARYTMYCPYNAVDAVERGVTPDEHSRPHRVLSVVSLGIALLVGGYFVVERANEFFGQWGLAFHVDDRFALLLLIPAAHLAYATTKALRAEGTWVAGPVRKYGLGAIVLVLLAAAFSVPGVTHGSVWNVWLAIMAAGSVYAALEVLLVVVGRRRLRAPGDP